MVAEPERGGCIFCAMNDRAILARNDLAFAIHDEKPVTYLHSLILPRRHLASFFDLTEPESRAIERLVRQLRDEIVAKDGLVEGFNIGINVGKYAGQTIFHCHCHLIPRRRGDVADPRGGVRCVVPPTAPA
jgi:ATP adenylyltransferase